MQTEHPIRRRFLKVEDRVVHYLRAGDGPPAVLIHSSPANAFLLLPHIQRLARTYTCFAFDTPGFGSSDALKFDPVEVSDLADAVAATMRTIGLPRCPVFGTHTGAAIALELGVGHPELVTGLVLDGLPAFTTEEMAQYFGNYFQPLVTDPLGGHYAATWTRFRDQSIWFPWCNRYAENLNPTPKPTPEGIDRWVHYFFQSGKSYQPAYKAASFYGEKALDAVARLTLPAVFTATVTDMLYPHLKRLPPLKQDQTVREIGRGHDKLFELMEDRFAAYGAEGSAPSPDLAFGDSDTVQRQFVDVAEGQILLRTIGRRSNRALVFLHDAPGSALMHESLIRALGRSFYVIAPDLPGCGESSPIQQADMPGFASAIAAALAQAGVEDSVAYGVGFGSSVALQLAISHPRLAQQLMLRGVLLPDPGERADFSSHYAPPIQIAPDSSHWYRTWMMLRDTHIYFPWYSGTVDKLRRIDADFSADWLHKWTFEVMKGHATYQDVILAALGQDAASLLPQVHQPLMLFDDPAVPFFAFADRIDALGLGAARSAAGANHSRHALDVAAFAAT